MKKLNAILLATDFSSASNSATKMVKEIASRFGSRVTLLHVLHSPPTWPIPITEFRSRAAIAMQEVVNELEEANIAIDESNIAVGHPADTIIHKGNEIDANLIVIGAVSDVEMGLSLGTTAEAVISRASSPILAVKPGSEPRFQSILCPVDLSQVSGRGLRNAIAMAEAFDGNLLVLTVVPAPSWMGKFIDNTIPQDVTRRNDEKWRKDFKQLLDDSEFKNVVWGKEIRSGIPHTEIVAVAHENNSDLIVMGSSGRTGLNRMLMGSVTQRVTRQLPCSILAVKHDELVEEWLEHEISIIKILQSEAEVLMESKSYEPAIAKFSQVLARNPYHLPALEGQGRAHEILGHGDQAARCYRRCKMLQENLETTASSLS